MSCAYSCIKYLLFFFNFLFALGGLAILIVGVLIQVGIAGDRNILEIIPQISEVSMPSAVLIAVGAVIFIIAFFGCCGAIRESHCMIVTFAMLLLTLLVIQVAIATYAFIKIRDQNLEEGLDKAIKSGVAKYYDDDAESLKKGLESIQSLFSCCGYYNYKDFLNNPKNTERIIPRSCCKKSTAETTSCTVDDVKDVPGCTITAYEKIKTSAHALGGLALGIAAVELVGIIFSFCLANSIRNVERRGYKV